jgi:hypothetical protein
MNAIQIASAWKSIDDTLRSLERVGSILKPLHRNSDLAGIGAQLKARRTSPFYVCYVEGVEWVADTLLPGSANSTLAGRLRPGVLLLDTKADLGVRRHFCDVSTLTNAEQPSETAVTAPLLFNTIPAEELDSVLALFGAARQAWLSIDETERIAARQLEEIDRLMEYLKDVPPSAPDRNESIAFFRRLDVTLVAVIERERNRLRERETLQRNFELVARRLVSQIDSSSIIQAHKTSSADRLNLPGIRKFIGKSQIDVRLQDTAINTLVEEIDRSAHQSATNRVHRVARELETVEPGQLARHLGLSIDQWLHQPEENPRIRGLVHEAIAGAGRNFHVKFERLGAVNRLMRARMEIAGLLMLVFLGLSAAEVGGEVRKYITAVALGLALLIAIASYFTSRLVEDEKLDEELERLREQLAKTSSEAAARYYTSVLSDAVDQLEDLRKEVKIKVDSQPLSARPLRAHTNTPPILAALSSVRSDLVREMGLSSGPAAVKQQIGQLIGPGGTLRALLK